MGSSIPPKIAARREDLFGTYQSVSGGGDGFDATLSAFAKSLAEKERAGEGMPLDNFDHSQTDHLVGLARLFAGFVQQFSPPQLRGPTLLAMLPPARAEEARSDIPSVSAPSSEVGLAHQAPAVANHEATALSFEQFIKPEDDYFDHIFGVQDTKQYVREWRQFLKLFLFKALYVRRMLELPEDDSEGTRQLIAREIQYLDMMMCGAMAFNRFERNPLSDTWEYKFAAIQRDKVYNTSQAVLICGEMLGEDLASERFKRFHAAALETLMRFSDPFMHLRDLGPYGLNGLPIHFDFISPGVDLHKAALNPAALDEAAIRDDALRFFAVRTAIDIITDVAAQHSLRGQTGDASHLSIQWDSERSEIRVSNINPEVNILDAFKEGDDRRRLLKFRRRIGHNARIRFERTFAADGARRIDGISIIVPPIGIGENSFAPTERETDRLGSRFEDVFPSEWSNMSGEQRDAAIGSAALFGADQGLEPEEVPAEELANFMEYSLLIAPDMIVDLPVFVR